MRSDDPYSLDYDELRFKLRMDFAMQSFEPLPVIEPEHERLPEPLQASSRAMVDRSSTRDERRAAAGEFLILSGEYL